MDAEWRGALVLPDGTAVRGRGRRQPLPGGALPEHGLYLGGRLARRRWTVPWPSTWLLWPDFGLPRDPAAAAAAVVAAYELARDGARVEVACGGGTGRTGTVLACMAQLAGVPADESVGWVRAHYRLRAVETPAQRRWVLRFAS